MSSGADHSDTHVCNRACLIGNLFGEKSVVIELRRRKMRLLLKDALKALCRSNHWSYAMFWRFGWKNSGLLIWEECHYESSPSSFTLDCESESLKLPFNELMGYLATSKNFSARLGMEVGGNVDSLIDKMILNKQINVVGEGMVGRAAFTGSHQWILSKNYTGDADPPKVLEEVHQQFSAGIQTIVVIPIPLLGVVQLGSSCTIMESMGFVSDVKNLILNFVELPGVLLSESCIKNNRGLKIGKSTSVGVDISADSSGKSIKSSQLDDCGNQLGNSSHGSGPIGRLNCSLGRESEDYSHHLVPTFRIPNLIRNSHNGRCKPEFRHMMKSNDSLSDLQKNQVTIASLISPNPDSLLDQLDCLSAGFDWQDGFCQSIAGHGNLKLIESSVLSGTDCHIDDSSTSSLNHAALSQLPKTGCIILDSKRGSIPTPFLEGCILDGGRNENLNPLAVDGNHFGSNVEIDIQSTGFADHLTNGSLPSNYRPLSSNVKYSQGEFNPTRSSSDVGLFQGPDKTLTHSAGLKSLNEHVPGFACEYQSHGSQIENPRHSAMEYNANDKPPSGDELSYILGFVDEKNILDESLNPLHAKWADNMDEDMNSISQTLSTTIAAEIASDNLLEAVISKGHFAAKQDSNDDVSCRTTLTTPNDSIPGVSPKHWRPNPSSFRSGCSKDDLANCSKTTSVCGSQICSWVDQANSVKRSSCMSTAYPKRSQEVNKSGRKRLKPGENPRPRPKDRQMIQDRLRELREIVPNGAKYSIDALLEKTIKHMLFLQSVTKHADKLKQTGESKIISKESGLFLKENFEHGATWAFEVGSQSMSCPIIVEDLNLPRQMLVEMVCEERGFFLEIADLIRGMGLTILKGMMEARNGQLWAQFTVEANRDVTRMEVFMSLVHLLEHTMKGGSLLDPIKNKQGVTCNPSRATPISATGGFRNLR